MVVISTGTRYSCKLVMCLAFMLFDWRVWRKKETNKKLLFKTTITWKFNYTPIQMSNYYHFTSVEELKELSKPMICSTAPVGEFRVIDFERFRAKFGVTPTICAQVWNRIVSNLNIHPPVPGYSRLNAVHILYALFFLRVYPTTRQCITTLGRTVGQNQFRKYGYFVIRQIAALSDEVVSKNLALYIHFLLLFNADYLPK